MNSILIYKRERGKFRRYCVHVYVYIYICGPEGLNHTVKVRATITADRCETREMPRHQMAHDRCNLIPPAPGAFAFDIYIMYFIQNTRSLLLVCVYVFKGLDPSPGMCIIYTCAAARPTVRPSDRPCALHHTRSVYLYLYYNNMYTYVLFGWARGRSCYVGRTPCPLNRTLIRIILINNNII